MSHELRTPLNAIIGFTGTLLMRLPGPLTGEQDQQLRIVQASGRQLLLIINDVLDVARIEAGSLTLTLEAVDVCAVVRTVVAELAPAAQDKQLTLVAELPGDPVILHSDPRALHQILVNLTSNAVKFTQHGGVTVSLRDAAIRGGRGVELVVADTGVGIAASDFSRLFTKFGQLGTAGSTSPGGTGLGLYLSRTLVERLSGRIRVESQPSRGSRFVVTFGGRP
jgi:protein-histidine pros-kinase